MINPPNLSLSKWALAILVSAMSNQAFAFVDGQLAIGRRNAKWNQDPSSSALTSDVLKVSAHLDPIPLVPVSFGLALYYENWKVSESDQGLSSLKSYSAVPEITAWLPIGEIKPYARVGYSILSAYTGNASIATGATTKTTGSIALAGAGTHVGAGVEWEVPVVPMLSVFGEFEYSNESVKLAKDKIGDVDVSGSFKNITLTSTAILIGAKLGI